MTDFSMDYFINLVSSNKELKDFIKRLYNGLSDREKEMMEIFLNIVYDDGYEDGYDVGHDEGHNEGYEEGFDDGYEEGYNVCQEEYGGW